MTSVSRVLAVWLTPAALLAVPAALATHAINRRGRLIRTPGD
jgi:paraquat-inducible protein B